MLSAYLLDIYCLVIKYKNKKLSTKYLLNNLLGSCVNLNIHSKPRFAKNSGAFILVPATHSKTAPIPTRLDSTEYFS